MVGGITEFFCSMEKLQIECADRVAEILFNEGNLPFINKFYGKILAYEGRASIA